MSKKLIPKFQSPWTPINFKAENSQEHRVTNNQSSYSSKSVKHSYNTKLNPTYTVGDKREKVEYKEEINPKTGRPYTIQEKDKPLSGTDPVGLFYVEGTALGPIFKYAGIAGKYLLGRFGSGALLNWARSSLISRTMDSDALTGGIKRIVDSSGNVFLRLSSHTKNNPRQLKLEPKGNNQFRVHTQTWNKGSKGDAGLSNIEKQMLYEGLYNELPDGATILFPESRPDYLATRGTVAGLQRLSRDSRFSKGNILYPLLYLDKNGISTFYGTDFIKNSELLPKTIFRTIGYKGGNIKDKYSAFFTTDPRYAKQYGKVQKYLIESDNFNVAGEPLIGTRDPVGMDMFIYQNTRNNPNSRLIIGHDAVTDEFPYLSNGTEMLSLSPNNYTAVKVNKPRTSLAFFKNLLSNSFRTAN